MPIATDTFAAWLEQAHIHEQRLTPQQHAILHAAFNFRQQQGDDFYATRILSHFLLHCGSGLKVAQLARLLRISRQTASGQQKLSAKQTVQEAHHRMAGRSHGKLLPRFAGPIAAFLLQHPDATRFDLIDFIDATFGVRVSRIALYHFLKKFGLQLANASPLPAPACPHAPDVTRTTPPPATATLLPLPPPAAATSLLLEPPAAAPVLPVATLAGMPAPPFSSPTPTSPVLF